MKKQQHFQIVCGGRDFEDRQSVKDHLTWLKEYADSKSVTVTIVSGGARGADSLAHDVATELGLKTHVMPAQWRTQGKSAGYKRNMAMAQYLLTQIDKGYTADVVAFPGGVGTQHMRDIAAGVGLGVFNPRKVTVSA